VAQLPWSEMTPSRDGKVQSSPKNIKGSLSHSISLAVVETCDRTKMLLPGEFGRNLERTTP